MRVVLALLLASAASLQATTLVAVWTPERLYLGADSLMLTESSSVPACKISNEGSTYFALSGLVEESTAGFSLRPIAREAMKRPGGINDRLEAFVAAAREPLVKALLAVKHDAPDDYHYLETGHPVVQAIFGEMQENGPVLAVASFQLDAEGNLREHASVLADGNDVRGPRIIYAGQQGRIRDFIRTHRDWYTEDTTELIQKLIQLEIDSGTGRVGGPVDIVTIGASKTGWLQKKPECGD